MGEQEHKSRRMPNGILSTNLNILNKGNEPTFIISNRKDVTELTLVTDKTADLVSNGMYLMRSLCQTTDAKYFKLMTWKLPSPHIATPDNQ